MKYMKYIDALRIYNEGKDKWCVPRKGSEDYVKIRIIRRSSEEYRLRYFSGEPLYIYD